LLLYAWEDLTYEEIGEALAVPVGTVRSRLNRVRRKLREPDEGLQTKTSGSQNATSPEETPDHG
jgi:DNA-directed RNA polymerase specialized sigma24 family protein